MPVVAFRPVDLVGAEQGVVQPPHDLRHRVRRIEALIRVGRAGQVRIRRHLPAGEVDRLETCLDHLDGLPAGHGTEGVHVPARRFRTTCQEAPETLCSDPPEGAFGHDRAAQAHDLLRRVGTGDAGPALVLRPLGLQLLRLLLDPSFHVHEVS